jgi:3-oxoacyl-[acyl-carrier protein] reductase
MGILDKRGNLAGRRAIVIGGGVAIGRAVTLALAEAEIDVAFCDIDAEGVRTTSAEARAMGRKVLGEVANAIVPEQLAAFYASAGKFFDSVDIVVNVVGGTLMQPLMEKTPEACAEDIQRNYGYVVQSFRHAIPLIRKTGRGGSITSFTTIEAHRAAGGFAVYAGAKAATTNFSKAMAWELGPEGIRVNTIAPDTTDSRATRTRFLRGSTTSMPTFRRSGGARQWRCTFRCKPPPPGTIWLIRCCIWRRILPSRLPVR